MTPEEAIEILQEEHDYAQLVTYVNKALNLAIEALKKQIPKELSYEGDGYDDNGELIYDTAFCPNCEKEFDVYYCEHGNYCPNCGQALDWSDEE